MAQKMNGAKPKSPPRRTVITAPSQVNHNRKSECACRVVTLDASVVGLD